MTITVLASGQSNAIGRNVGGFADFPDVTVWNNQNDISTTANPGTGWEQPDLAGRPFVGGCNNPAVQFCTHLARLKNEPVRLILVAKGSEPISLWMSTTGVKAAMFTRIEAVLAAAGVSAVDIFFWHQGETDNGAPINAGNPATYATKFNAIVAALQSGGYINSNTPVLIGELASMFTGTNPVLETIASASNRVNMAYIGGQPTSDGTHFLADAQVEVGMRYVQALSATIGTPFSGLLNPVALDGVGAVVRKGAGADVRLLSPEAINDSRRRVAFSAYHSVASVALPVELVWHHLNFDTVEFNQGYSYNPGNGVFSPPAGVYAVSAQARITAYQDGRLVNIGLFKNGTLFKRFLTIPYWASLAADPSTPNRSNNSGTFALNVLVAAAGQDSFDIRAYVQEDSTAPVVVNAADVTWFSAWAI